MEIKVWELAALLRGEGPGTDVYVETALPPDRLKSALEMVLKQEVSVKRGSPHGQNTLTVSIIQGGKKK